MDTWTVTTYRKDEIMSRIKSDDNVQDILIKMSEGNPGALAAMMEILEKHNEIDPQAAMGGLGAILILDTWGIYGTEIYVLFSDKCGKDVRKMLMLIRATQLGLFPQSRLNEMARDQSFRINLTDDEFKDLDTKVCEQLSGFQKAA